MEYNLKENYERIEDEIYNREKIIEADKRDIHELAKEYKYLVKPSTIALGTTAAFIVVNAGLYLTTGNAVDALLTGNSALDFVVNTVVYLPFEALLATPVILKFSKSYKETRKEIKKEAMDIKEEIKQLEELNIRDTVKLNKLENRMYKNSNLDLAYQIRNSHTSNKNKVKTLKR